MATIWVHDLDPFLPYLQFSETWGIRYYGLAYVLGFFSAYGGLIYLRKKGMSSLNADQEGSLLTWLILGTLIGGRLGYCLMYDWEKTVADPISIIAFWDGGIEGMASHGGILGVVIALILFSRKHHLLVWELFDNLALLAPIGICFGRIANFINGELWGRATNGEWGVIFPGAMDGIPRHPSQLYEALGEGLILFLILWWVRNRQPFVGLTSVVFIFVYAKARIICEFFREPDEHIGYLWGGATQGQLLSIGLLVAAFGLFFYLVRRQAVRGEK
ncbi:MAG: prolipoprotein diacylglyceryl transferase [Verrucomicrobiota bacterium]